MLSRQRSRLFTPAKRATHTVHFICDHRFTVARAAEDNAAFALAARDCFSCRPNEHRIVHRFFAECAEVFHLVPERSEQFFHLFLVTKSGVICAKRNFHAFVIPSEVEESLIIDSEGQQEKTIVRDVSTSLDMTIVIPRAVSPARSRSRVRVRSGSLAC